MDLANCCLSMANNTKANKLSELKHYIEKNYSCDGRYESENTTDKSKFIYTRYMTNKSVYDPNQQGNCNKVTDQQGNCNKVTDQQSNCNKVTDAENIGSKSNESKILMESNEYKSGIESNEYKMQSKSKDKLEIDNDYAIVIREYGVITHTRCDNFNKSNDNLINNFINSISTIDSVNNIINNYLYGCDLEPVKKSWFDYIIRDESSEDLRDKKFYSCLSEQCRYTLFYLPTMIPILEMGIIEEPMSGTTCGSIINLRHIDDTLDNDELIIQDVSNSDNNGRISLVEEINVMLPVGQERRNKVYEIIYNGFNSFDIAKDLLLLIIDYILNNEKSHLMHEYEIIPDFPPDPKGEISGEVNLTTSTASTITIPSMKLDLKESVGQNNLLPVESCSKSIMKPFKIIHKGNVGRQLSDIPIIVEKKYYNWNWTECYKFYYGCLDDYDVYVDYDDYNDDYYVDYRDI